MTDGAIAEERLTRIADTAADGDGVTRLPWTDEHRSALTHIRQWMAEAGLETTFDAAGTLIGRSPGAADKPVLLMGSHQDSVRRGGRYDGIMGVALACLAAERFRDRWDELPIGVEVLAFADEEGVRFPTALIGPRALAGTLDPSVFDLADADGHRMRDAMAAMGCDPEAALGLARDPARILGYVEAHIEQGPVLEAEDLPLGVVTGICGISRATLTLTGETGHAGTVPMAGRRDALVAAARIVAALPDLARGYPGIRATVGALDVAPNVVNAIPARVTMTVETRSIDDEERRTCEDEVGALAQTVAADTGVDVAMERTYAQPAVACDDGLTKRLGTAVEKAGGTAFALPSGATHDASAMADLCPVAMLFVRCRGGISHRADEFASAADMGAAVDALAGLIAELAAD